MRNLQIKPQRPGINAMRRWGALGRRFNAGTLLQTVWLGCLLSVPAWADSPWENAVNVLEAAFTTTIARGLSLVAIVVGGLMFAFGEGDSKRTFAGILFGVGMAIGAVNFIGWLFPG